MHDLWMDKSPTKFNQEVSSTLGLTKSQYRLLSGTFRSLMYDNSRLCHDANTQKVQLLQQCAIFC